MVEYSILNASGGYEMKRIILICIAVVMMGMNIVCANIGTQTDKFTSNLQHYSYYPGEVSDPGVLFSKFISDVPIYTISFNKAFKNKEEYGNIVEIIVDKNIVEFSFIDKSSIDERKFYNHYSLDGSIKLSESFVKQMVNAERVAFKVYYENSPADIIVVPKEVLAEWKEVSLKEK